MTIEQYWIIMAKQWKLVVVCFILVGLGTYIGTKLMVPLYQATALVQVSVQTQNNQADYNSLLASDQLVQTEAQLAVSDPVLRAVATHYHGMTAERLTSEVTATAKLNTQLFQIDVLDASPTRGAAIATDVATTLISQQLQVLRQNNLLAQQQLQQNLTSTQSQIDATTAQIASDSSRGYQANLGTLRTRLSRLQQYNSQWEISLAQLELVQAQSGNFLRIAQAAQPGLNPVRPNLLLNTGIGFLAGAFLGVLLAIMFELLNTRVRTPEELSQVLNWPVLATVWRTNASRKEEVINPDGQSVNSESYRILRTNVGFSAIDKPLRSLLVTSSLPKDGKSVIASNLAIFMAKAGKNTLLIDADLRRPTLHEKFALPAEKLGLSNVIMALSMSTNRYSPSLPAGTTDTQSFSLDPYVHSVGIPNLRIMPSGPLPPNPTELLDSKAMDRLFSAIAVYGAEIVIFDTPPIIGLSDASILASKVDGVLIVADITRANKKNLKQVKMLLTQAGAHVLGCVVNKEHHNHNKSPYSYYYQSNEQKMHNDSGKADEHSSVMLADALNHGEKQLR